MVVNGCCDLLLITDPCSPACATSGRTCSPSAVHGGSTHRGLIFLWDFYGRGLERWFFLGFLGAIQQSPRTLAAHKQWLVMKAAYQFTHIISSNTNHQVAIRIPQELAGEASYPSYGRLVILDPGGYDVKPWPYPVQGIATCTPQRVPRVVAEFRIDTLWIAWLSPTFRNI